jgi:hypothetical protein
VGSLRRQRPYVLRDPPPAKRFDLVHARLVLVHLEDRATALRVMMAERGADLAYGRTLPRLLREWELTDVSAEAYFPIASRACAILEAATVRHVSDQLLAAQLATPEEIETHLRNLTRGDLDLEQELAVGGVQAKALRADIAAVLQQIDAVGGVVEAAIENGDQE